MTRSHRRYDPLSGEWVLCSPGRLARPWLGAQEPPPAPARPAYDPSCYMCPGNARAGGARNPDYRGVFLFDNDFPSLVPDPGPIEGAERDAHPLFVSVPARGKCRVLVFSERHDLHLGTMEFDPLRAVVDAWASESLRLKREEGFRYVQIFENRGEMMGASNPHPHGQMWAVGHVPGRVAKRAELMSAYARDHVRDLLGDYLAEENERRERLVESSKHWTQVVPFWAVWPFETLLVPHRPAGTLAELNEDERNDLALLLGSLVRRYDRLFGVAFPYSMGWYERPNDGAPHEGFRLHAVFLPPLLRSAAVRKFVVGYELTAEAQRDFTPEEAAERLRAVAS